ncbi:hypothetical protein PARMER_04334 [Parabacteroides merdae ATCC 43184]|nr:hypothetical protein PARMER_04334 [Parabacteroides merdae ATCC 43184]
MANGYLPVQENVGILFLEDQSFSFFQVPFNYRLYIKRKRLQKPEM